MARLKFHIDTLQGHQTKSQVRQLLIEELGALRCESSKRNLRVLGLPADGWGFEQLMLDYGIGRRIDSVIGLEAKRSIFRKSKRTAYQLRRRYPDTKFHLFNTTDYRFWEPGNNGGLDDTKGIRGKCHLSEGLDFIWLDWMNCWSKGPHANLNAMAANLNVFNRAWKAGKPGLLYVTLCSAGVQELRSHMAILSAALYDYTGEIIRAETADAEQRFQLRFKGLTAWINLKSRAEGIQCIPTKSIIYREPGHHKRPMILQGWEVYPVGADRNGLKPAVIAEMKPSRIIA